MKKNVFILMILGICTAVPAWANYPIGTFIALKGADGAACNATITTERCGPSLATKCYESGQLSAKSGIKMTKTDCGGGNATSFYTYDGDVGTGIYYQGELANCGALNALKNNSDVTKEPGYAWFVKNLGTGYDAGKLYIWTDNKFPDCPSGGVPFQGPQGAQGEGVCTGHENDVTAVKNTVRQYVSASGNNRGYMKLTHSMCDDQTDDVIDKIDDKCLPVMPASSSVCVNGTYLECTPQDGGTVYYICADTAGTTFSSALSNKEDAVCVGANANSSSVERKKTVSYTAPTGSEGYGTYSWKTAVGKVVNKSVKCDNSETTISSTPDKCEEIAKPNGVCTDTTKVYYRCTQQNDNSTQYNLCASGNSVLGAAQTAAETAVAAVDPCAGNTNSSTIIKTTSTTTYSRGTKTSGVYSAIGKKTVTKTACNGDTYTTDEQDDCIEVAKPANVCTAATSAYLRCYNAQTGSDQTYYVCQDLGTGNNSLANKIDGKADASAVTQSALESTLGSTYLKPSDTISASQLPSNVVTTTDGKINAGVLPSTVVTIGDDATHGLNTLLATKKYVTESGLESAVSSAVSEKTVTFGNLQITLDEALELVGKAAGTCTRTPSGGDSENAVSCSNGALGSVSTTGKNTGN